MTVTLSPQDAYTLARAFVGLSWDQQPVGSIAELLLSQLDLNAPEDLRFLRKLLGPDLVRTILGVDPTAEPPETVRSPTLNVVPELPESAQLTPEQTRQAAEVGYWLTEYVDWAGCAANETPLLFQEGAGLYLAAIAVGRRLYIQTPWRQSVFPNLYLMIVAVSTYHCRRGGQSIFAPAMKKRKTQKTPSVDSDLRSHGR